MSDEHLAVKFRLNPPVGPRCIRSIRKTLCYLTGQWEYPSDISDNIGLAASEAINNAREHASQEGAVIEVTCRIALAEIKMVIEDKGSGTADPGAVRRCFDSSTDAPRPDSERGRGFFLMRSLMDEVSLSHNAHGGVRITMIKRVP